MKESKSKTVLARMTITRRGSSKRTIIEVHSDASFNKFYTWYSQEGRKHKRFIMTSHRGDGIMPYYRQAFEAPGLEVLAESLPTRIRDFENAQIKIFKKREYKRLLNCAADQLGGGLPKAANTQALVDRFRSRRGIPVSMPANYLTLQKRMDIITGDKR